MFLLINYWPVLAVIVVGVVPFVIIGIWRGRLTVSQIAVFLSVEVMLAITAQQVLKEAGLIGLFAGEYNAESVEAFTQVCVLGCQSPAGQEGVCPRYCRCVVRQARNTLSYQDMLTRTAGVGDEKVDEAWTRADGTCRRNLGLR